MAEFSVSYDFFKKNDPAPYSIRRQTVCFSGMFGFDAEGLGCDSLKVYYWNQNDDRTDSDWFINEFVMKHLTKRFVPDILTYQYQLADSDKAKNEYWQTLEVTNLNKINGTDLYMLLMLFRYPQENPRFPTMMRNYVEAGDDIEWAFAKAHSNGCDVGYGHLVMHDSTKYLFMAEPDRKNTNKWSFLKLWESIPLDKENGYLKSYKKHQQKFFGINNHFRID